MNINHVLMEYDSMYGKNTLEEIEEFLNTSLAEAYDEQDYYSAITLLNELMGFCRDTDQKEKGIAFCNQTVDLLNQMGLGGTVEYATSLLNVANAYRAFGLLEESNNIYQKVEENYKQSLAPNDFGYASLYNNWGLLYQEMNDFDGATSVLKKALRVVDKYPHAVIEQATTRTNLAGSMFKVCQDEKRGVYGRERIERAQSTYLEAISYLKRALAIFENDGGKDFHYSAALAAMGDALYIKGNYGSASKYYSRAMVELEKHVGKTDAYNRIQEKYESAFRKAEMDLDILETELIYTVKGGMKKASKNDDTKLKKKYYKNNMQRCRAFYKEQGAPMIHELFSEYEERIAVGLVGEGSDCFGFDDAISMDHDYAVGFCMWLNDKDYDAIAGRLQMEYEKIITLYGSYYCVKKQTIADPDSENIKSNNIDGRRGVFRINEFYNNILFAQVKDRTVDKIKNFDKISEDVWYSVADESFATAVNGEIFRDDEGDFTYIRNKLLDYYPRKIWILKLAEQLHYFCQYAQCNYARSMAREDRVAALLCVARGVESAMRIAYLIDKTYSPYYKWMNKGFANLHKLKDLSVMIDDILSLPCQSAAWEGKQYSPTEINEDDVVAISFEAMARRIQGELVAAGLVTGTSTFLDDYCQELVDNAMRGTPRNADEPEEDSVEAGDDSSTEKLPNKEEIKKQRQAERRSVNTEKQHLIEEIVLHEWNQFDKVKNEGGRADCQDDWNTFSLMRKSQYMTWNEKLLESYLNDLLEAEAHGWNLITEKYARMMESTAPTKFEELKDMLPKRSDERLAIQEEIIKIQIEWMEEFAAKYPKMAGNSRNIHTYEDGPYNTSYETYLRGELGTYSDDTLLLYGRFVVAIKKRGGNLAYEIMTNTALGYGYKSVADAEKKL